MLLEVADRLSLKNDLEIAREIQQAMLPRAAFRALGVEAFGMTRPANTVGGDFYDILPLPDGRVLLALGDVAGKGSPAALLMALLLAMMRTLVDEGFEGAELVTRLNAQIVKHAPRSRFVTLFVATFDPATGALVYVNAGQNPPLLRRGNGTYERLRAGGMALGMFENATYTAGRVDLGPGDVLVMYSDGITEAEDGFERPFDEAGVQGVVDRPDWASAKELGWAMFAAVEAHQPGAAPARRPDGARRPAAAAACRSPHPPRASWRLIVPGSSGQTASRPDVPSSRGTLRLARQAPEPDPGEVLVRKFEQCAERGRPAEPRRPVRPVRSRTAGSSGTRTTCSCRRGARDGPRA